MKKFYISVLVVLSMFLLQPQASALLVVSDISDYLSFSFLNTQVGPPVTPSSFPSITINQFFTIPYGSSIDFIARLSNVSDDEIALLLNESLNPSLFNNGDLIFWGQGASIQVINGVFGPNLSTGLSFKDTGLPYPDGSVVNLGKGEYIDYVWAHFNSSEITPTGNSVDMIYALDANQSFWAFNNNQNLTIFGLDQPFGVRFGELATVTPEPTSFLLMVLGLFGFSFIRKNK